MNKSRLEWKVGLFVTVGLVLLAVLLLAFSKGMTFFRPTYTILLQAPNVGGLKTRAGVLMSGVPVGTVNDINLSPEGTNVTIGLRIYSQYQIHTNAQFVIESSGFLGDQYVAILARTNEGPVFHDLESARAQAPFDLQEVARSAAGFIQRIDVTARNLNDAIVDVRRLVLNEQTLTNLSAAAGNLRVVSERAQLTVNNLNSVVESNRPAISESASNLVLFTEQINQFAGSLRSLVTTNTPEIDAAVKNLEVSTEELKAMLEDVRAGKGLVGHLLNNEQMVTNVYQLTANLSITSSNLNRLGLWGILWQHKPPKTNAPASSSAKPNPKYPFE
jgi:phospholipid/cholesterol/gamma-HCH transport system substrate-binding protein